MACLCIAHACILSTVCPCIVDVLPILVYVMSVYMSCLCLHFVYFLYMSCLCLFFSLTMLRLCPNDVNVIRTHCGMISVQLENKDNCLLKLLAKQCINISTFYFFLIYVVSLL